MKTIKLFISAFVSILLALTISGCVEQNENTAGNETESHEQRVISTSPAVCEIMYALDIDLVGVPASTIEGAPDKFSGAVPIGSAMAPDMEIIKELNPTDVVGPDTLKDDLKVQYDNIGAASTFVNMRSVEGMYEAIEMLGEKYGRQQKAEELIDKHTAFMEEYSNKNAGKEKPTVLVLMGLPGSYLAATPNSYSGSLVALAGGINVFEHDEKDFLNINTEEMLSKDPDIIIRTAHALPEETMTMFSSEFAENDIWKHFRAVQNDKVFDVTYKNFGMSATFGYPDALKELEYILYGDENE